MKRKTNSLDSKVYSYHAHAPSALAAVRQVTVLAHRYRNLLCQIEIQRRTANDAALIKLFPKLGVLKVKRDVAEKLLKEREKSAKSRNSTENNRLLPAKEKDYLRLIRGEFYAADRDYREARKPLFRDPKSKELLKQNDELALANIRKARAACGIYWGSYLLIEKAAEDFGKGAPPRYRPFQERGRIGVQLQGGLSVAELLEKQDTQLQLHVNGKWCTVKMRLGSNPDRSPIWCDIPIFYNRPLPPTTRIKNAYMIRRRYGSQERWDFNFALEGQFPAKPHATTGAVGVDVGWRLVPGGLRVAYWVADDQREGTIVLPHSVLNGWAKAHENQGLRDETFNAMRLQMLRHLATLQQPDWMILLTTNMGQWKNADRLSRLYLKWHDNRFAGDEEIYAALHAWNIADRGFNDRAAFCAKKAENQRLDIYRQLASFLRKNFAAVYVEDIDWRKLQERPPVEDDSTEKDAMRRHQRHAACGMLLELLKQECGAVTRPAQETTMRCHACGELSDEVKPENLMHTCAHCGKVWDQDYNAAINLLRGLPASAPVVQWVA